MATQSKPNEVIVSPKPIETSVRNKNDKSFHMDRGKIVCNGCGGHFPNLILFENHTHDDDFNPEANGPARKSGPKNVHKTFSSMSQQEMDDAMERLPELKGCYVTKGLYTCYLCGKGFPNPFLLFSHKIAHPPDMKPQIVKPAPGIQTQTPNSRAVRKTNLKCIVPTMYQNDDSEEELEVEEIDVIDDADLEEVGFTEEEMQEAWRDEPLTGIPEVTAGVVKQEFDPIDDALPISFDGVNQLIQVPWMSLDNLKKDTEKKGKRTYIYKMLSNRKKRGTFVNLANVSDEEGRKVVVVKPNSQTPSAKGPTGRIITNPGQEKGITFSELDMDKMKTVFKTLPGLEQCKMVDDKFVCDRCNRKFKNPYLLFSHRLLHKDVLDEKKDGETSTDDSKTTESKLVFYSLPGLNKCKMVNGEYHCDECSKKFSNPYLLFTHKMSVHDAKDDSIIQNENENVEKSSHGSSQTITKESEIGSPGVGSSELGSIFGARGLSNCKIVGGRYQCDKCSKLFISPYLLMNHRVTHEKGGASISEPQSSANAGTQISDVDEDDDEEEEEGIEVDAEDDSGLSFTCNLCRVEFQTLEKLAAHIEIHAKDGIDVKPTIGQKYKKLIGSSRPTSQYYTEDNYVTPSTSFASSVNEPSESTLDNFPAVTVKQEPVRIYPGEVIPTEISETNKTVKSEPSTSAGTSGIGTKRPSNSEVTETAPLIKTIKQEPVRIYPGEVIHTEGGVQKVLGTVTVPATAATQTKAPTKIKVKVEIKAKVVPSTSSNVNAIPQHNPQVLRVQQPPDAKYQSKYNLKKAVVDVERLDVKPNQYCILK